MLKKFTIHESRRYCFNSFPQADLTLGKLRPALVIAVAPGTHADLLLALISSRTYQAVPDFDEIVTPSDTDYATSGLKVTSAVRLARLATVAPAVINARLGSISAERLQEIRNRLSEWLKI
jgi:mRNA interferase MazF